MNKSNFEKLAAINVNDKTEDKNGLTYLSWAWAVDQLLRADSTANWAYPDPKVFGGNTLMVFCSVTAFGKTMTAQLPVMNHRNQPIPDPDAFQINTAMQRCLAKAIALHGLGLYIYAGEDVPATESKLPEEALQAFLQRGAEAQDKDTLTAVWKEATAACKDANDAEAHQAIKAAITERSNALKAAA